MVSTMQDASQRYFSVLRKLFSNYWPKLPANKHTKHRVMNPFNIFKLVLRTKDISEQHSLLDY